MQGFCSIKAGTTINTDYDPLNDDEILDAEIFGAFKALERALEYNRARRYIKIPLENQGAALAIQNKKSSSSIAIVKSLCVGEIGRKEIDLLRGKLEVIESR